jgi:hypothetical protein
VVIVANKNEAFLKLLIVALSRFLLHCHCIIKFFVALPSPSFLAKFLSSFVSFYLLLFIEVLKKIVEHLL